MSPKVIVQKAKETNLNLITISDHNSGKNCPALSKICLMEDINCFYGIEVSTIEEVHSLCIFDKLDSVMELDNYIYQNLPDIKNLPEKFGDQVVVNENDEIIEKIEKYLGNACQITIENMNTMVLELGGLFIPAHVNRSIYSLQSQLGFVPALEPYSAIEVYKSSFLQGTPSIPETEYPHISNSDAHFPDQIGSIWNEFDIPDIDSHSFSLETIKMSLSGGMNKIVY
jgi:PHP family Zn ribbon phosphoesterase